MDFQKINNGILTYAPAVVASVQTVEAVAPNAPSELKHQAVLDAIFNGASALSAVPNPTVQGVSVLVALTVSILNSLGIFTRHKAVTAQLPLTGAVELTRPPAPEPVADAATTHGPMRG